jgi:hypothetical protein
VQKLQWNGMNIEAYPDASDREWYFISPKDMLLVTGDYSKPMWMSDVEGAGGRLRWAQGSHELRGRDRVPARPRVPLGGEMGLAL